VVGRYLHQNTQLLGDGPAFDLQEDGFVCRIPRYGNIDRFLTLGDLALLVDRLEKPFAPVPGAAPPPAPEPDAPPEEAAP